MHASLNLALISLLSIFFGNLNTVSFLLILWATIFMIKVVDNLSKLSAFRLLLNLNKSNGFAIFFFHFNALYQNIKKLKSIERKKV